MEALFDSKVLSTYLLVGESLLRRREYIDLFKSSLKKRGEVLVSRFEGSEEGILGRVGGLLKTPPLFGGTSLVLIEDGKEFLRKEGAEEWVLKRIKEGGQGFLLICFEGIEKKSSLYKVASSAKAVVDVSSLTGDSLMMELKRRAERLGIEISSSAVRRLIELVGDDFDFAVSELQKVALLPKKRINEEDVNGLVADMASGSQFSISNGIERFELESSLAALWRAFRNGIRLQKREGVITKSEEVATYLIGQITSSLIKLRKVYKMVCAGASDGKIAEALSMGEWARENVLVFLKKSGLRLGKRMNEAVERLAELDRAVKGGADAKMEIEAYLCWLLASEGKRK
ncbi:MAG: hypothetical protein N2234_06710 [Planctomycetota bacterium]|nr:hypothetical protein [Planctomycetota bacterium]